MITSILRIFRQSYLSIQLQHFAFICCSLNTTLKFAYQMRTKNPDDTVGVYVSLNSMNNLLNTITSP